MTQTLSTVSKFLSYVLRHKPDAIGLQIDPEGWANIEELIKKANIPIDLDTLHEVVATSDKRRFTASEDGHFIRANQGHSINVDLGLNPVDPPEFLYHGTAIRFLHSIKLNGLSPQSRQHVHLSGSAEVAFAVGQRHGKPIVLKIAALEMHKNGHCFYKSQNGVWLTTSVPVNFISDLSS